MGWNENTQFESGVLTYVNEAAWGDLRELLNDIGINRQTIRYSNVGDQIKSKDLRMSESDANWRNLMNARFTMVDMTDYDYPSANEIGTIPMTHISALLPLKSSIKWPQSNALIEINRIEGLPMSTTSRTHRELQEARLAEAEEEEEEDEDEEDEDEDDEDEDGEEEEEDEGEEEADPQAVPDDIVGGPSIEDRYFMHNETIRGKYNEVEIDSFMKLLDISPHT